MNALFHRLALLVGLLVLTGACSGKLDENALDGDDALDGGAGGTTAAGGSSSGASAGGASALGGAAASGGASGDGTCEDFLPQGCGCTCTDGQISCPDTTCLEPTPACDEGETMQADCNTCSRSEGSWLCTQMECHEQCKDGDTKQEACNTCSCSEGVWLCTRRACVEECVDGETRQESCNTCTCKDDNWSCTEKACAKEPVACGGWLGDTCADDEYCAYEEGAHCGAADASSVCMPRAEVCPANYDPVCGCDGKTYSNACSAGANGTGVLHAGACED